MNRIVVGIFALSVVLCHAVGERPNIVFILADDQGWNGTSVQLHPDVPGSKSDFYQTPRLEQLAKQGVTFSQAYAPGPMCSPTRASLQTGKSPAQLGMTNVGRGGRPANPSQRLIPAHFTAQLPVEEKTIGEMLSDAGYATAWFGKWHLGEEGPAAHGYDESDGPTGNQDGVSEDPQNPKDLFGVTERGIAFMKKNVEAKQPFYLQLWHYAVHGPVQSNPETEAAYAAKTPGKTHSSNSFAAMTENLDTGVGRILDKIDELGISDNTYVIYMSDHGSGTNLSSNAPLNFGKQTLYEGGIRVPLIIRGPGVAKGVHCNEPTAGWDLFPTFCELAEVKRPLPNGIEGVSLKPLLDDGKGTLDRDYPLAFHFPHYGRVPPHSALVQGRFKLIKFYEANESQLFDLSKDIGEQNDLSGSQPNKRGVLDQQLTDYLSRVDAQMPSMNPEFDPNAVAVAGGPGGRRGGGPRMAQLQQRRDELQSLEAALEANDLAKVGELIAEMRAAAQNAPARPAGRGPGGANNLSPQQRRQQQVQQFADAHKAGNVEELRKLVTEAKTALVERARTGGRPGAGRPAR